MSRLPIIVANEAVNFALDNFSRQAWMGDSIEPWRKRKNPTKWGKAPERNGRAILVDKARLKRGMRVQRATWNDIVIGNDAPYAVAHNEGLRAGMIQRVKQHTRKVTKVGIVKTVQRKKSTGIQYGRVQSRTATVSAHTRRINQNIPRRRFIGDSPYLRQRINRITAREILQASRL